VRGGRIRGRGGALVLKKQEREKIASLFTGDIKKSLRSARVGEKEKKTRKGCLCLKEKRK